MTCLIESLCLIVGLHAVSLHSASSYVSETTVIGPYVHKHYESFTPGIYVRTESGLTAGAYRNSYGQRSAYVGWTVETEDERFALTLGAVTGYKRTVIDNGVPGLAPPTSHQVGHAVQPLLVPSVRFGLTEGTALRLAYLPEPHKDGSAVVHLSIESRW